MVPVPEYKVSTLYSGTELGTDSSGTQCLNTSPFCAGALAGTSPRAPGVNTAIVEQLEKDMHKLFALGYMDSPTSTALNNLNYITSSGNEQSNCTLCSQEARTC